MIFSMTFLVPYLDSALGAVSVILDEKVAAEKSSSVPAPNPLPRGLQHLRSPVERFRRYLANNPQQWEDRYCEREAGEASS